MSTAAAPETVKSPIHRFRPRFRRMRAMVRLFVRDVHRLSQDALALLRRHLGPVGLALAAFGGVLAVVVMPLDLHWLEALHVASAWAGEKQMESLAKSISYWGDFLGFNLVVLLGLLGLAHFRRSRRLRYVVTVCLLGSVVSGLTANGIRATTGRARPSAKGVDPGFHGPSLSAKLHAFPSGHTATAFGASIPVAVAAPPVGIPMLIVSGGVAWSRLFSRRHHPSDVLASIVLASLFGIPLGLAARRRHQNHSLSPTGAGGVETAEGVGIPAGKLGQEAVQV